MTVLLHCDLALIADTARLRAPFVPLGVVPEAAGSLLMPAMMGDQRAALALYTGEWITRRGRGRVRPRVARSSRHDRVVDETMDIARRIAAHPLASLVESKKARARRPHRRGPGRAGPRRRRVRPHDRRRPPTLEALDAFLRRKRRSRDFAQRSGTARTLASRRCMTIAQTRSGKVEGFEDDGVAVFQGIPYAAPPVGARRWLPPEREDAWDGVRDATAFSPQSAQGAFAMNAMLGRRRTRRQRGQPLPQRLDARVRRREAAGDGVDPRRRVRVRFGRHAVVRRHARSRSTATSWSSRSTTGSARSASCTSPTCSARSSRVPATRASSTRSPRSSGCATPSPRSAAIPTNVTVFGESAGGGIGRHAARHAGRARPVPQGDPAERCVVVVGDA